MPTKYREDLHALSQGKMKITRHPQGCLMLFPKPDWERFSKQISGLPMSASWTKRLFLGHALDAELDSAGRILVPPELRVTECIEKEALLLGVGSYFELWNRARYQEKEAMEIQAGMEQLTDSLNAFTF